MALVLTDRRPTPTFFFKHKCLYLSEAIHKNLMKMVSVYILYTLNTLKAHESENLGITDIERDSGVTSAL
jgi:hypothetical protein